MTADHAAARARAWLDERGRTAFDEHGEAASGFARDVLALLADLERVTKERDQLEAESSRYFKDAMRCSEVEARLVEARRALEQIANAPIGAWLTEFREIARAALAAMETQP